MKVQNKDKLVTRFPNLNVALRICLSIIESNAEGERSFSKLKQINDNFRWTMNQDRLSSLAPLCTENELARNVHLEDIIKDFSDKKSPQNNFS